MSGTLPPALLRALEHIAIGSRHGELALRATRISEAYRQSKTSETQVVRQQDALAYALSRMPATYAAASEAMARADALLPDYSPRSLLDVGAGPGTGTWAAVEAWPSIRSATLVDHNAEFIELARRLVADASAIAEAEVRHARMQALGLGTQTFDLVLASYALTELSDADMLSVATQLWAHTTAVLVLVEPGRPRDYRRLMTVRSALLALGASVVAPCPHAQQCPLLGDDWCHFSVRLPRSRTHRQVKGAKLAFEDEKFSYLVFCRPGVARMHDEGRVVRHPQRSKFDVSISGCMADGTLKTRVISKRDAEAFRAIRRLEWGDALEGPAGL